MPLTHGRAQAACERWEEIFMIEGTLITERQFGIPSYWIINPDRDKPGLTVFELRSGRYQQVAQVAGDEAFEAALPFPVSVTPSALVRTSPLT